MSFPRIARLRALPLGCAALAALAGGAGPLRAQAAVDPNMAPRAAELARQGERKVATDLLGRYLATAPDDGRAWFQLGRFYRLDAADWHHAGHVGDPDGQLLLDLAGIAFGQANRLLVDSASVYGGLVDMDRGLLAIEDSGWAVAAHRRFPSDVALPPLVLELGRNLLGSCPAGGVIVTGGDLEGVAVWFGRMVDGYRPDLLPLRPDLYATDSLYRDRMAVALAVAAGTPVRAAVARAAEQRPVCLTPDADTAVASGHPMIAVRLVRVLGAGSATADPLSITDLLRAEREQSSVWATSALAIYARAARWNALLCDGLLLPLESLPGGACGK